MSDTRTTPRPTYDVIRMADDIAIRGWNLSQVAIRADISPMTVGRFLRGERQTAATAKKIARALGRSIHRYLISSGEAIAS